MGGQKEGGDCWGEVKHIKGDRAREGASGGKTRRKELTHILMKLLQTTGTFLSFTIGTFSLLTQGDIV